MSQFDNRIFKVVLSYGTTELTLDGGLDITAQGQKFANALQDECTITIDNLQKETRDQLATQLTPFNMNQQRKTVQLYAGRVSTGLALVYQGDIVDCITGQPPDIRVTIKSKTCQFFKNDILAQSANVNAPLSGIAGTVAQSMGLSTKFEATDKTIANYSYTGSSIKQVNKLAESGGVDAFVDGGTLVVKNKGQALNNVSHTLSKDTGMIGVPQYTEYGVRVTCLWSPSVQLGGGLSLISELNPLLNGDYTIYKLGFNLASRDNPFYSIIEASKFPVLYQNAVLPQ